MEMNNEERVRHWIGVSVGIFITENIQSNGYTAAQLIERMRALADEAELRLINPNWPEKKA